MLRRYNLFKYISLTVFSIIELLIATTSYGQNRNYPGRGSKQEPKSQLNKSISKRTTEKVRVKTEQSNNPSKSTGGRTYDTHSKCEVSINRKNTYPVRRNGICAQPTPSANNKKKTYTTPRILPDLYVTDVIVEPIYDYEGSDTLFFKYFKPELIAYRIAITMFNEGEGRLRCPFYLAATSGYDQYIKSDFSYFALVNEDSKNIESFDEFTEVIIIPAIDNFDTSIIYINYDYYSPETNTIIQMTETDYEDNVVEVILN